MHLNFSFLPNQVACCQNFKTQYLRSIVSESSDLMHAARLPKPEFMPPDFADPLHHPPTHAARAKVLCYKVTLIYVFIRIAPCIPACFDQLHTVFIHAPVSYSATCWLYVTDSRLHPGHVLGYTPHGRYAPRARLDARACRTGRAY